MRLLLCLTIVIAKLFGCGNNNESFKEIFVYGNKVSPKDMAGQVLLSNGIQIRVNYIPANILKERDMSNRILNHKEISQLNKKYQEYIYFTISLSKQGKELISQTKNQQEHGTLVQLFSFNMAKFVSITTDNGKVVPVEDYTFQRDFGIAPENSFLFAFLKKDLLGAKRFDFILSEFGLNTGNCIFKYKSPELYGIK